jgi:transposase
VRPDSSEDYREMLMRMARESGIEIPTAEERIRLDRSRKGKKGVQHGLGSGCENCQTERRPHASCLQAGACNGSRYRRGGQGDTTTLPSTLAGAAEHFAAVDAPPTAEAPAERSADKGYRSRDRLKTLDGGPWKSRISEPHRDGFSRRHGDDEARRAVYNNRTRLRSGLRGRDSLVLDGGGGMRQLWLLHPPA